MQKVCSFAFVLTHFIDVHAGDPINNSATLIDGVWTDDFRHVTGESESWKGWRINNKRKENGKYKYNNLRHEAMIVQVDGHKYWGPIKEDMANDIGPNTYLSRWFKCKSETTAIFVEYYTAECGKQRYDGDDGTGHESTELYVDWIGDNHMRNYKSTLGPREHGYNAFNASHVNGHWLENEEIQSKCYPEDDDRKYWVQRHGAKWIPDINDNWERIRPALERFRTVIEINTGLDAEEKPHLVLLFNISLQCVFEEDNSTIPKTVGNETDTSFSTLDDHNMEIIRRILKLLGIIGIVCGVCLCMGCGVNCCLKKRKMTQQTERLNSGDGEFSIPMSVPSVPTSPEKSRRRRSEPGIRIKKKRKVKLRNSSGDDTAYNMAPVEFVPHDLPSNK